MANDLRELLGDEEHIVLETRQHWFVIVSDAVRWIIGILVSLLLIGLVASQDWLDNTAGDWTQKFLWAAFAVFAVLGLWHVLGWWTERFYLTTSKIVYAHGILNRDVTSTPLSKIDEITLKRPLLGRMLGFGRLEVENATGGTEPLAGLEYLPRPVELYRVMTERCRHQRMVEGGAHRDDDGDGLVDRPDRPAPSSRADDAGWTPPGDSTSR